MSDHDYQPATAGWRDLLTREHLPKFVTLCFALWLHASNSMLAATTMPSAIEDIGGLHLISWTFALYLAGSIAAAASISAIVSRLGIRPTMLRAAVIYTVGCIVVASAQFMPILLCGRLLQGVGGGALIALVYISQDRYFPNSVVARMVAMYSVVWTTAAFCGPAIGGAFATWGLWRMAYWLFAFQGLLLIPAIVYLFPGDADRQGPQDRIPLVRIGMLFAVILMFSLSSVDFDALWSPLMVVVGTVSLIWFVIRDRQSELGRILPMAAVNLRHPIGNGVLATFLISLCIMSFIVYGPLILINLYGLSPLLAGFVILVESLAWGFSAVMLSGTPPEREPVLIRVGSLLIVIGLIGLAVSFPSGNLVAVIVTAIIGNAGMGMMWGFIIKRMGGHAEPGDEVRTASMLPITQQTGFALGAALSGLIANGLGLEDTSDNDMFRLVSFWLFAGFVPLAMVANLFSWRFVSFNQMDSQA